MNIDNKHITGQQDSGEYRNRLATVNSEGKRVWIYPKKPSGRFYSARTWVSYFLLLVLFATPFLRINGHPVLLLNILEGKFYLLGFRFWPQDFYIFGLVFISMIIFIVLFTVVYGRLFCGWICPQTIFMEMVFRKIEYWIEGDAAQQKRLDAEPLSLEKLMKKSTKHVIFFSISFLIGNLFLSYIIGTDPLMHIVTAPPTQHIAGFSAMIIFSLLFYFVFSSFREQVCTIVCPYGRFQGVLLDKDSIAVHYDFVRGEPRTKGGLKKDSTAGHCIDCHQCVHVCPTGIDIRNGTQLECINCTACMDACDTIMDKVKLPKGLIRYASYNELARGVKQLFTPRSVGYTGILFLIVSLVVFFLVSRSPLETTILRTPGIMYHVMDNGDIKNLYNIKIMNKTYKEMTIRLEADQEMVNVKLLNPITVMSDDMAESVFFLTIPGTSLNQRKTPVSLLVFGNDELMSKVKTTFISPGLSK
ncbi:MAG: cytochrome c oxidase accessory protein CcoG [Candidatus Marinimicrobia bacterium]|nr:cytochrome c oxidase accessory protein CcoG [Candidatus Neomarinimicrobiota bacterium]